MLDEKALRKPGWNEGHWVELADSQLWCFPKPRIRFRPRFVDGKIEVGGGASFGAEYDANLDILFGAVESEAVERLRVKFEMAVRLLSSNYDLTPDDLCSLIVLEPGDPVAEERWAALSNVIVGDAPKPMASTSDAPA